MRRTWAWIYLLVAGAVGACQTGDDTLPDLREVAGELGQPIAGYYCLEDSLEGFTGKALVQEQELAYLHISLMRLPHPVLNPQGNFYYYFYQIPKSGEGQGQVSNGFLFNNELVFSERSWQMSHFQATNLKIATRHAIRLDREDLEIWELKLEQWSDRRRTDATVLWHPAWGEIAGQNGYTGAYWLATQSLQPAPQKLQELQKKLFETLDWPWPDCEGNPQENVSMAPSLP
ncbi:MAG: hypothetical protein AAFR61_15875 [Bacteroidota bacterium]